MLRLVANALRQTLPEFLMAPAKADSLKKFIAERQDTENMRGYTIELGVPATNVLNGAFIPFPTICLVISRPFHP